MLGEHPFVPEFFLLAIVVGFFVSLVVVDGCCESLREGEVVEAELPLDGSRR